jgi:protein MpaA
MAADPLAFRDRGAELGPSEVYGASLEGVTLRVWVPAPAVVPRALVLAGVHGNEPETVVVLSAALRSVPRAELRAAVVLCANPDGVSRGLRGNARGVDLNRNFPTSNWGPPLEGELPTGAAGGSEPETQALVALIERLGVRSLVSLHADLACVDDPGPSPAGRWLTERTGLPLVAGVGYPTPGSLGTWCAERGLEVTTLEFERAGPQDLRRKHGPTLADLLRGAPWA